jgi:hypothetical protein
MMLKGTVMKLSLSKPAMYQIKVPGMLDTHWADPVENITVQIETCEVNSAITTLTGEFDQAALQGLLRRIHSLGLPLISVIYVEVE